MTLKPLPPEFETALFAHIKTVFLKGKAKDLAWNAKDIVYFAKGILKLNEAFTTEKHSRAGNYFQDPVTRSGYLAYFLPVNAMKAYALYDKAADRLTKTSVRILDIGSGPLTLLFGYLFHCQDRLKTKKENLEIEFHAVEQNEKIFKDGLAILEKYLELSGLKKQIRVKVVKCGSDAFSFRTPVKSFDLILMGNFLNEMTERQRQAEYVLRVLERFSQPDTLLFFLEPAGKKSSRDLQALRDAILETTPYRVLAPCLHQKTCPLNLTAKGDWCHFSQNWQTPKFINEFDKVTELKKTNLLYSYLILSGQGAPHYAANEFVAISNTMPAHGRLELLGCGPAGRIRFIRSNANRGAANQSFDNVGRGQKFSVPTYHSSTFEVSKAYNLSKNHAVHLKK